VRHFKGPEIYRGAPVPIFSAWPAAAEPSSGCGHTFRGTGPFFGRT
jgi:hypothetical protein